jgi:LysM repeat protein
VKQALVRTSSLRVFSFRPTVVNGHLVLRGDVNTADQYRQAERVARQVEGVEAVSNELTMGGRPVTEARLSSDEESASSDDAAVYHTVRQGDNLWDIARKYQVSVSQIKRLNDFRSSTLRPGQRIRIR